MCFTNVQKLLWPPYVQSLLLYESIIGSPSQHGLRLEFLFECSGRIFVTEIDDCGAEGVIWEGEKEGQLATVMLYNSVFLF